MPRGHVERQFTEPVGVGAPDERAHVIEDRGHNDEDHDLNADRSRLEHERDRKESPREKRKRHLLRCRARSIERQSDGDKRDERKDERERTARCQSILMVLILSPILIPFTTSIPDVTIPKFVYCLSRKVESFFTTNHWLPLLIAGSWPRAIPTEPSLNERSLYSDGTFSPPVPVPSGSPPWTTQSSTRWKILSL